MAEKARKTRKKVENVSPAPGEMSGGLIVQGDIHAKRDVIMGDQYNLQDQRIANLHTPAEFIEALALLRAEIASLKQMPELTVEQAQMVEIVDGQVQQAIDEAQKPKPLGARINATLTSAKATMDLMSGTVASAVGLGATLAGLAPVASRVFGS